MDTHASMDRVGRVLANDPEG